MSSSIEIQNKIEVLNNQIKNCPHYDTDLLNKCLKEKNDLQQKLYEIMSNSMIATTKTLPSITTNALPFANNKKEFEYSPEDFVHKVKSIIPCYSKFSDEEQYKVDEVYYKVWIKKDGDESYINIQDTNSYNWNQSPHYNLPIKKLSLNSTATSIYENNKPATSVSESWQKILNECCKQMEPLHFVKTVIGMFNAPDYKGVKRCQIGKENFIIWIAKRSDELYINIQEKNANAVSSPMKKLGLNSKATSVFIDGACKPRVTEEWRKILMEFCKEMTNSTKNSTDQKTNTLVQNTVPQPQLPQISPILTSHPFIQPVENQKVSTVKPFTGSVEDRKSLSNLIEVPIRCEVANAGKFLREQKDILRHWIENTASFNQLINFLKATTGSSNLPDHLIGVEANNFLGHPIKIRKGTLIILQEDINLLDILKATFSGNGNLTPEISTKLTLTPSILNQGYRKTITGYIQVPEFVYKKCEKKFLAQQGENIRHWVHTFATAEQVLNFLEATTGSCEVMMDYPIGIDVHASDTLDIKKGWIVLPKNFDGNQGALFQTLSDLFSVKPKSSDQVISKKIVTVHSLF